ncbi:MAG: GNAT family N-acetyltransferase, partial [Saprospiraceae bacterium]|nr:GNAT family N-acetyltransferase [Saprospiraceae bacterium]
MIELKTYNRSTLEEFINLPEFSALPFLPISYHRAISHIQNPRADRDDVLLILAYDHSEMVGYLGVLADWIFDENNHQSKCGWLSCMWINPLSRGKGISKKLVAKALETWNKKILVTEFTAPARGLYDSTGAFKDLQIKEGVRHY